MNMPTAADWQHSVGGGSTASEFAYMLTCAKICRKGAHLGVQKGRDETLLEAHGIISNILRVCQELVFWKSSEVAKLFAARCRANCHKK